MVRIEVLIHLMLVRSISISLMKSSVPRSSSSATSALSLKNFMSLFRISSDSTAESADTLALCDWSPESFMRYHHHGICDPVMLHFYGKG